MRAGILSIAIALGGCSLLVGTDDFAGNGALPGTIDGGTSIDGSTTGDGPGPASEAGADAGTDGGKSRLGPLVFVQSQDSWKTRVDGFFELTFTNAQYKHLTEWFDLGATSPANLAGTPGLYEPPRAYVNNEWCEDAAGTGSTAGAVDVEDHTPVFVTFNTYVHHIGASGIDVKRWARFTIHATGRVAVETSLANAAPPSFTANPWSYHDVQLSQQVDWDRVELANKSAYGFFAKTGAASLTVINLAAETTSAGGDREVRWEMPSKLFAQSDSVTKLGELQLGATQAEAADRVNDVRNPSVEVLAGGNGGASTYYPETGIYLIPATSGTLEFGLGPTRTRFHPTFEIVDLAAPNWKLSLDGVVIASAQQPVTAHAVARYDEAAQKLDFAYLGVIPANAPAAKRTFVLER